MTDTMTDRRALLRFGVVCLLGGLLALALPPALGLSLSLFAGTALLVTGVFGILVTRGGTEATVVLGSQISAAAAGTGGLVLIAPLAGLDTLTPWLITLYLGGTGALRLARARTGPMRLVVSGGVALAFSLLLITGQPVRALWVAGVLLAVDLLALGTVLLTLARRRR
ncbi:MAG: hypothetical protein AAGI50_14665 [Pseudomonadota bacterium]